MIDYPWKITLLHTKEMSIFCIGWLANTGHSLFSQCDRWKMFLVCISLLVQLSIISCLTICISFLNHMLIFYSDLLISVFIKAHHPFNGKRLSWWGGLLHVELGIRQICSHSWHRTTVDPPSTSAGEPAPVKLRAQRSRSECFFFFVD